MLSFEDDDHTLFDCAVVCFQEKTIVGSSQFVGRVVFAILALDMHTYTAFRPHPSVMEESWCLTWTDTRQSSVSKVRVILSFTRSKRQISTPEDLTLSHHQRNP